MPKTVTFTIRRSGTLILYGVNRRNQCAAPGHMQFAYVVELTCGPKLDNRGYIVDHNEINHAVQSAARNTSCEKLASRVADFVVRTARAHKSQVLGITVRVNPLPEGPAQLTYSVTF